MVHKHTRKQQKKKTRAGESLERWIWFVFFVSFVCMLEWESWQETGADY